MTLTLRANVPSLVTRSEHGSPPRPKALSKTCCVQFAVTDRRGAILLAALVPQVVQCLKASAKPVVSNKEVPDDSSALIQGLLAKSKENKEKYTKDRLLDYYRRNYKDYFAYEKGLGRSTNERGVSNENQQRILEWLKNNP